MPQFPLSRVRHSSVAASACRSRAARAPIRRRRRRLTPPLHLSNKTKQKPTKQTNKGLRLDTDGWLREYDACKAVTAEVVQLVQERNMNHPGGGPEASRLTASARRKLGALGASLDGLYAWLDGPEASEL